MARHRLKADIEKYMTQDKDKLMDLSVELATIRVLFQEFMGRFPEPEDKNYGVELNRAISMVQATGSLVEKISKIESRNTLTAAQVLYLRVVIADILTKWIPDVRHRELAIADLNHRVAGGVIDG
jgi:glutamate mutase epsilon subunit